MSPREGAGIDLSFIHTLLLLRNDWKTVSFQGEIFDLNGPLHPEGTKHKNETSRRNSLSANRCAVQIPRVPVLLLFLLLPFDNKDRHSRFSAGRDGTRSLSSFYLHWRFVQPRFYTRLLMFREPSNVCSNGTSILHL